MSDECDAEGGSRTVEERQLNEKKKIRVAAYVVKLGGYKYERSARGREPIAVSAVLPKALGSRNRRALILGWAYYLDTFNSYSLRSWLLVFTVDTITGTLEVCPSWSSRTRETS
ncbi:hypothetical protein EZV62_017705 [Acer yangbiense]|uniref:Uncharacterized protein n=1 Tax=Acer yangbiense TaxID=1000413 RepID=A0A5C7HJ38_9ROSI|nr:hypothetical protein EZV62_017705 [Acer yangbiense]